MKETEKKKDKEKFTLIKIKPRCKDKWGDKYYYAGDTLTIPTISVDKNIHTIIKEI